MLGPKIALPVVYSDQIKSFSIQTLKQWRDNLLGCKECPLSEGTNLVYGYGNPNKPDIMFVGEGPGAEEDQQGIPFTGKAGQLLDKMIASIGYERKDVYTDNIVKHRPPNNRKPTMLEAATCVIHVMKQIELIEPTVLVCVGMTAAEHLLQLKSPMYLARGKWHSYTGIPTRVIYHPAYILRLHGDDLAEKKQETWQDLLAIKKLVTDIKSGELA